MIRVFCLWPFLLATVLHLGGEHYCHGTAASVMAMLRCCQSPCLKGGSAHVLLTSAFPRRASWDVGFGFTPASGCPQSGFVSRRRLTLLHL